MQNKYSIGEIYYVEQLTIQVIFFFAHEQCIIALFHNQIFKHEPT